MSRDASEAAIISENYFWSWTDLLKFIESRYK